jgi:tetratricopeptide (TPR) repeat protein
MRLDPNFPFYVTFNLGNSYYSLRRYDEAIAAYKEVLHRNPEWAPAYSQLAAIYAELGHEKEARAQAEKFRRLDPGTTTNRLKQHLPFKNKRELERLISAWRRAGLE